MTEDAEPAAKLCLLQYSAGRIEQCPGNLCPFWETGGAGIPGGCAVERLGLIRELAANPSLAHWLLDLRTKIDRKSQRLFHQLLPPGLRD